jgi:site-specific recombinase XerD
VVPLVSEARACKAAGIPWIAPYEGTKHSFATNALNRGVCIEVVQAMLGHRDRRSTERYAKLRKEALVEEAGIEPASDLSNILK